MAFSFSDILTSFLLPGIKEAGTQGLVQVLDSLYEKDPVAYETVLTSVYRPFVLHLKPLVVSTKTKLDDTAIDIIITALVQSAESHGVALPDVTAPLA